MKTILLSLVMAGLSLGMLGCESDDSPETTTVVVTNTVTGVVQTNVVAVEDAVVADAVDEVVVPVEGLSDEEVAIIQREVQGDWSGSYQSESGETHLQMTLAPNQYGEVEGLAYFSNDSRGIVTGQFSDATHVSLSIREQLDGGGGRNVVLEGQMNAQYTFYSGTWVAQSGSGTFSFRK